MKVLIDSENHLDKAIFNSFVNYEDTKTELIKLDYEVYYNRSIIGSIKSIKIKWGPNSIDQQLW